MSTTPETPATETVAAETAAKQTARKGRRWPWIVALAVVAALGATGTGVATAQANESNEQLASLQEDYIDLETRAGIAQSSLDMMRDQRDRLEAQVEEQTEELETLRSQVEEPAAPNQG